MNKRVEGQFIRRESERLGKADKEGRGKEYRNKGLVVMAKSKALKKKMTSHEAVREWKKTGKKPKGLKRASFPSTFYRREE